jgi:phage tail sheath protein FI
MPQYLSPGVYVEEMPPAIRPIEGVATSVAAFVGIAADGPYNAPTLVTNWSQFVRTFGEFVPGAYLAHAVYGFFNNGGSTAYVVRVGGGGASSNGSGKQALTAAPATALPAGDAHTYEVTPTDRDASGLSVEVADASEGDPGETFKLLVKRGDDVVETFDNLSTKRTPQNATRVVNAQSELIRLAVPKGATEARPTSGTIALKSANPPAAHAPTAALAEVTPGDYVGDSRARTGFGGLEAVEEITMVAMPDLIAAHQAGAIDLEGVKAAQLGLIAHCELMGNRMAILDTPPGFDAQSVKEWRVTTAGYDSKFATLYWPHVKVFDPTSGTNVFIPPSGHIAGLWARSDGERGVHKAPANDVLRGVIDVETNITRGEHDLLNPEGINVIRAFPGRGIRVWGARTLSSDGSWRYVNVRRLFNYVESSILANTDWVVFEPNDEALWGRIRRTISGFLYTVWADGALFGSTPEQAFYVKCDNETNPSESIESGRVVTEIGLAPTKPAEFVVFRLAQLPTGTSALSE